MVVSTATAIVKSPQAEVTPLHDAAAAGSHARCKLLIENGANIKSVDSVSSLCQDVPSDFTSPVHHLRKSCVSMQACCIDRYSLRLVL